MKTHQIITLILSIVLWSCSDDKPQNTTKNSQLPEKQNNDPINGRKNDGEGKPQKQNNDPINGRKNDGEGKPQKQQPLGEPQGDQTDGTVVAKKTAYQLACDREKQDREAKGTSIKGELIYNVSDDNGLQWSIAKRSVVAGDARPMDILTWAEAKSACGLDGARLPTESELAKAHESDIFGLKSTNCIIHLTWVSEKDKSGQGKHINIGHKLEMDTKGDVVSWGPAKLFPGFWNHALGSRSLCVKQSVPFPKLSFP